jgi:N,N-dimethylformamidase beta subunit-like, C-terminal
VQVLRSGPETEPTYANNEIKGVAVGAPLAVDWTEHANAPAPVMVQLGSDWPSGVYAVRIDADDGRVGFAPLVVRPSAPQERVAVVIPTSTWSAYNFYDADGDGWGDT